MSHDPTFPHGAADGQGPAGHPVGPGSHDPLVVWHDVECGCYTADLELWLELAAAAGGPVLDIGAGTGRVALVLARAGHHVTALDREPALLRALTQRAATAGLSVATVAADAQAFALGARRFGLIAVPMQTVLLLADRPAFLAAARRHLVPGGLLAMAVAVGLEPFESNGDGPVPEPDRGAAGGWSFASQPVAVRVGAASARIERVRRSTAPGGEVLEADDVIELATLDTAQLDAEGRAAGLTPDGVREIAATEDHVGSTVVLLRG